MASHGSTAAVADIWKEANAPGNSLSPYVAQLDFPMKFAVRVTFTVEKADDVNTKLPFMNMFTVLLFGRVTIQWVHVPFVIAGYPGLKLPLAP